MTWAANMSEQNGESFAGQTGEWDVVRLDDVLLPGVCKVTVSVPSSVDQRKGRGSKRSSPRDEGRGPIKLKVSFVVLPEHYEFFRDDVVPVLCPADRATGQSPRQIDHPTAEAWGVDKVLVGQIKQDHPESGGTMSVEVELIEWVPEPKPVKVAAPAPSTGEGGAEEPLTALGQALAR